MSLSITADADALVVIRHVLDGLAEHGSMTTNVLDDLQIAVGEACANAVTHAYRGREPGPLDVDVAFDDDADTVTVTVRDRGDGVAASRAGAGLGMGVAMIEALADRVQVGRGAGDGHEVRMTFGLGPS